MSIIGISDKIILGKLNKTTAGFETYEIFEVNYRTISLSIIGLYLKQ